ncbi:MAG: hypothetical protein ACKVOR_09640 [Flavobacteriales bacterium]
MKWLLCVASVLLISQNFVWEKNFVTTATDFTLDELGNIYFVQSSSIEKQNAAGPTTFRTSELNYGNIENIDVTNPLKPFIYYRDLNKLVVLDNTLSQQGDAIDLFANGYGQVELVAGSRGDAYWLWDARNSELIRTDAAFNKLTSTGNLSVLIGKELHPVQLLERGNYIYLRDTLVGLLVFDVYGTYRTTMALQHSGDIQVVSNTIMWNDSTTLHLLAADWITEETITLPEKATGRATYFSQKLYLKCADGVHVWRHDEKKN